MPLILTKDGKEKIVSWSQYHKRWKKKIDDSLKYKKPRKKFIPKGCEMESPIYRQILKEVAQGYSFETCNKTKKIIRIKK